MIVVYNSKETDFSHNGLCVLSECISSNVTEELNGKYELVLEYPINSKDKWKQLVEDNIIKIDGQLFRIYNKVKTLASIKINARHIFYDLLDNLVGEIDIRGLSGIGALDRVMSNLAYPSKFTYASDISETNSIYLDDESGDIMDIDPASAIYKLLALYKGELLRNNFNLKMLGSIGLNRGVLVSYGKNIKGIEESLNMDGVCTKLKPIGKNGLMLPETFINSPYINNFANPKIKVMLFPDSDTEAEIRAEGLKYIADSKCDIPQYNYKIDFVELSKYPEYKDYAVLERVFLGDTVTIRHKKLNIELLAKVISTTKNSLTNKLEKIELGSFKPSISTVISDSLDVVKKGIAKMTSDYQEAINNATQLITGSKGGNVVIRQDANKKPYEILIMDTTNVMTALKVWRWNINGFGYSSTGINGPYTTAITMDGKIVSSFITALEISGSQITAGIIKSKTGKWKFDLDSQTIDLGGKLVYNGTDLIFSAGVLKWDTLDPVAQTNLKGTPGTNGTNGIQGPQGPQGPQGLQGSAANLPSYIKSTYIDFQSVQSPTIIGGIIRGARINEISDSGTLLADLYKNNDGGVLNIYDNDGSLNVALGSNNYSAADNNGGKLILYNDGYSYPRVELGISTSYGAGMINMKDSNNVVRAALYANANIGPTLSIRDASGAEKSCLRQDLGRINGSAIITAETFSDQLSNYIWPYLSNYSPSSHTHAGYYGSAEVMNAIETYSIKNSGSYKLIITQSSTNIAILREGDSTAWLSLGANGDLYVKGVKH